MGFINLGSFGDTEFGYLVQERGTGKKWVLSISNDGRRKPMVIRDLFLNHFRLRENFLHPDYTNSSIDELESFPNGLSMFKGRMIRWYRVQLNKDVVERNDFLRLKGIRLTQCCLPLFDPPILQDLSEMNTVVRGLLQFEEGYCRNPLLSIRRIDPEAWATLVDWIVEIVECFQLEDCVIFQALSFLDRFLTSSEVSFCYCRRRELLNLSTATYH
jgi:hypothetical protein